MAVRALKRLLIVFAMVALTASHAAACFGPKLYIGVGGGSRQELLFALVSLYVQEKTGVECEKVLLPAAADPAIELRAERVDIIFAPVAVAGVETLLVIPGEPLLVSGPRLLNDLQFTTVVPAVRKLGGLLTTGDFAMLNAQIAAGETPLAAVRRLFKERRWI